MVAARPAVDHEGGRLLPHPRPVRNQPGAVDVEVDLGIADLRAHRPRSPACPRRLGTPRAMRNTDRQPGTCREFAKANGVATGRVLHWRHGRLRPRSPAAPRMSTTPRRGITGLRQFLDPGQQRGWIEGETAPRDADERSESLELRFKYDARLQKLLLRPQAPDVLALLGIYGRTCIPIPRRTERHYWSVSCLPR